MKKILLFFGIISLMLILSGCHEPAKLAEKAETKEEVVKIGFIGPMTGDGSEYGVPILAGARIAVEEINEAGGIDGKQIEAIWEDGKCDPKAATTATQKLVDIDKVKIILGLTCSSEILAAAPITEKNKVIVIGASTSSPDVTKAGDFVFRTYPSDAFSASVAAEYGYKTLGAKKAAIINENKDYPQALARVFEESFEKLGGGIVSHETFNPEETEFKTQVLKIKESSPDVIYVAPQAPSKGLLVIRQIRDSGLNQQLLSAENFLSKEVVDEGGDLLEGLIGLEPSFDKNNPKAQKLFEKYKQKYNKEPPWPFFQASAYDDVYLIKEAIESVGMDTEKIRDWLYDVKDWDGAVGKLTIDENGDPIIKFAIKQIKNGEIVELS